MKKLLPLFLALALLLSLSLPVPALAAYADEAAEKAKEAEAAKAAEAAEEAEAAKAAEAAEAAEKAKADEGAKAPEAGEFDMILYEDINEEFAELHAGGVAWAFTLSRGDLWIIGAGLVLAVAAVTIILVIHKKKKV